MAALFWAPAGLSGTSSSTEPAVVPTLPEFRPRSTTRTAVLSVASSDSPGTCDTRSCSLTSCLRSSSWPEIAVTLFATSRCRSRRLFAVTMIDSMPPSFRALATGLFGGAVGGVTLLDAAVVCEGEVCASAGVTIKESSAAATREPEHGNCMISSG